MAGRHRVFSPDASNAPSKRVCERVEGLFMLSWIYILHCSDGRFYVGHTNDLKKRVACHNAGRCALFTSLRRPVRLVHVEKFETEGEAISRELQIKRWTHAKKLALINGDENQLHELSKSHDHA